MSAPEDRIKVLEDTVERIKNAWHAMAEERSQLAEENQALRQQLDALKRRMQAQGDDRDLAAEEQRQDHATGIGPEAGESMKAEIKQYIAEIDQCLEWLNSI